MSGNLVFLLVLLSIFSLMGLTFWLVDFETRYQRHLPKAPREPSSNVRLVPGEWPDPDLWLKEQSEMHINEGEQQA